jgi:hypothetical protein
MVLNLDSVTGKEYIAFGDNSKCKVISWGTIWANKNLVIKDVTLVLNLHFNFLSLLQFLVDDFEVRFKKGLSHVLDYRGDIFCQISLFG